MTTPKPRIPRPAEGQAWSPPLPAAPWFEHLVIETPGIRTHVAALGEGDPAGTGTAPDSVNHLPEPDGQA